MGKPHWELQRLPSHYDYPMWDWWWPNHKFKLLSWSSRTRILLQHIKRFEGKNPGCNFQGAKMGFHQHRLTKQLCLCLNWRRPFLSNMEDSCARNRLQFLWNAKRYCWFQGWMLVCFICDTLQQKNIPTQHVTAGYLARPCVCVHNRSNIPMFCL